MSDAADAAPIKGTLTKAIIWLLTVFLTLALLLGAGALVLRYLGKGVIAVEERLRDLLALTQTQPTVFRELLGQHQEKLELVTSQQRGVTQISSEKLRVILGKPVEGTLLPNTRTKVTAEISFFAKYGIKLDDPGALTMSFHPREHLLELRVAAPEVLAVEATHQAFRTDDSPLLGPNADKLQVELSASLPAALRERARAPERLREARRVGRRAMARFIHQFFLARLPEALGDGAPVRFVRVRYHDESDLPVEATVFSISELRATTTEPSDEATAPAPSHEP